MLNLFDTAGDRKEFALHDLYKKYEGYSTQLGRCVNREVIKYVFDHCLQHPEIKTLTEFTTLIEHYPSKEHLSEWWNDLPEGTV